MQNLFTCLTAILISVGLVVALPVEARAQNKNNINNQKDEKRENERVRKAEQESSEARKSLTQHQNNLKSALRKLDSTRDQVITAKRSLREAEELAEAELGAAIGIPSAIIQVNEKRRAYELECKPVLDQLHARPEWKMLLTQVTQAKADIEALRENIELEDALRDQRLKELNQIIERPIAVENKALQAKPECLKAREELDKASSELAELRKKLNSSKVESHPKVIAASKTLKEVEAKERADEKAATTERTTAIKAQRAFAQAQAELTRAKQADANDPNKSNRGKKK